MVNIKTNNLKIDDDTNTLIIDNNQQQQQQTDYQLLTDIINQDEINNDNKLIIDNFIIWYGHILHQLNPYIIFDLRYESINSILVQENIQSNYCFQILLNYQLWQCILSIYNDNNSLHYNCQIYLINHIKLK